MDAGQHRSLIEHVLEGADANRQIDRLVRDSFQLLGIVHVKRKVVAPSRASKAGARQFNHARRDIDSDAPSHFGSKGQEVMAIAATEVQNDIGAPEPGQTSHKRKSVFQQLSRVTVLLRRSR